MYEVLLDFFEKVLNRERGVLKLIAYSDHQIAFTEGKLVFTLKGLYEILELAGDQSYTEFRKMLYTSQLNTDLATQGYRVDIFESTQKVDSNWYQLREIK